jgi:hypothetical protein
METIQLGHLVTERIPEMNVFMADLRGFYETGVAHTINLDIGF